MLSIFVKIKKRQYLLYHDNEKKSFLCNIRFVIPDFSSQIESLNYEHDENKIVLA